MVVSKQWQKHCDRQVSRYNLTINNQLSQEKQDMMQDKQPQEFEEKVIQISRVSKKTKGGNKIGFSVLMVVGDRKGKVGVGLGKAPDVLAAMKKGIKKAKKKMIDVPLNGTTIPFSVVVKKGAGRVMLKPAPQGSGVIAGGPVRAVVEAAGVRDVSSKILGSENQSSSVYATFEALNQIRKLVEIKGIKLHSIAEVEAAEEAKVREEQAKAKQASEKKSDSNKLRAKSAKPKIIGQAKTGKPVNQNKSISSAQHKGESSVATGSSKSTADAQSATAKKITPAAKLNKTITSSTTK